MNVQKSTNTVIAALSGMFFLITCPLLIRGERISSKADLEALCPAEDLTSPDGTVVGAALNSTYGAVKLFDNVIDTSTSCWLSSVNGNYVAYIFPSETVVNAFMVKAASASAYYPTARAPKTFSIYGSNDFTGANYSSATWVKLDTESDQTDWLVSECRYYRFENSTGYKTYRVTVENTNSTEGYAEIDEMELYWCPLDGVFVTGSPAEFAQTDPAYGIVTGYRSGDKVTFSAPKEYLNDDAGVRATCVGWKLIDESGNVLDEQAKTEFIYIWPDQGAIRKLFWQWRDEYKVTAVAREHGTVTSTVAWVPVDGSAVIDAIAIPDAGYAFSHWEGDIGGADVLSPTISTRISAHGTLVATFVEERIVLPSSEHADATIQAAIDASPVQGVIRLLEGDYFIDNQIQLTNGVVVIGAGVDKTFICETNATSGCLAFRVSHESSILRGVTVSNAYRGVELYSGLVRECRFTECHANKNTDNRGAGAKVVGGLLVDCSIDNCLVSDYSNEGGGLYLVNGIVSNIVVTSCAMTGNAGHGLGISVNNGDLSWKYPEGGTLVNAIVSDCTGNDWGGCNDAIYIKKGVVRNLLVTRTGKHQLYPNLKNPMAIVAGGTVENATFFQNGTNTTGIAALKVTAGTVRNAIIWGNGTVGVDQTGGTITHCCFPEAVEGVDGNISKEPRLKRNGEGEVVLGGGSPAIDAGFLCDWMTLGATDLYGRPRIKRNVPDMGCSEWQPKGLVIFAK